MAASSVFFSNATSAFDNYIKYYDFAGFGQHSLVKISSRLSSFCYILKIKQVLGCFDCKFDLECWN